MFSSDDTSRKIKEDKYKILRMSLILGNNIEDRNAIDDFETSAREIDAMNQEIYLEGLASKYYDTASLEEEKTRLEEVITFINSRLIQRDALKEDFFNVTGRVLTDLDSIRDGNKLDEYKDRLKYIDKYLDNVKNIDKATSDIDNYNNELDKAYDDKVNSEDNNVKLENELVELFEKLVDDENILLDSEEEINEELDIINPLIVDSKKTLDIFDKSFKSLKKAGISGREEKEYYSYVLNAKNDYYAKMEKYFLLSLYRLILRVNSEFEHIFNKRIRIKEVLNDRKILRTNLEITEEDILTKLYSLLDKQYEEIKVQENNINNISILKSKIATREKELDSYKEDNQNVEILALLKEFCLIEDEIIEENDEIKVSEDNDDMDIYDLDSVLEEEKEEEEELVTEEVVADNQVIQVRECTSLDLINVKDKARGVMLRVGKMLIPTEEVKEEVPEQPLEKEVNIYNNLEVASVSNNEEKVDYDIMSDLNVDSQEEELELPSFDDLPTVSSLTAQGSISNPITSNEITSSASNSFWGNSSTDFDFPDINSWGDK